MTNPKITEDTTNGTSWAYDSGSRQLASYDTPTIAALKANYIVQQEYAGGLYWVSTSTT